MTPVNVLNFDALGLTRGRGADNRAALQAALDAYRADPDVGLMVEVPPGFWNFGGPVILPANTLLKGPGRIPCVVQFPTWTPGFVVSCGPTHADPKYRHAVDGYFDGTVRGKGFSTFGTATAVGVCNASNLGQKSPANGWAGGYDYWREFRGITVAAAFSLPNGITPGQCIVSVGGGVSTPGPWSLYLDGEGQWNLSLTLSDPSDVSHRPINRNVIWSMPPGLPVYRLEVFASFETGAFGVRLDGVPLSNAVLNGGSIVGARLRPNFEGYPLWVGVTGSEYQVGTPTTNVQLHALKVSNAARTSPAPNHAAAFASRDESTVWRMALADDPVSRIISIAGGPPSDDQSAHLTLVDPSCQPMHEYMLEGLTIQGGSPGVLIGNVIDFRMSGVHCRGGGAAVAEVPLGANYQLDLDHCDLSGADVCLAATDSLIRMRDTDVGSFSGPYAVRAKACDLSWVGGLVRFASPQTEGIVYFGGGAYGGQLVLREITDDSEDGNGETRRAFVVAEQSGTGDTSVALSDLYGVTSSAASCALELSGPPGGGGHAGSVTAERLMLSGAMRAAVRVRGGNWSGSVDATLCPAPDLIDSGATPHGLTVYRSTGAAGTAAALAAAVAEGVRDALGAVPVGAPGPADGWVCFATGAAPFRFADPGAGP